MAYIMRYGRASAGSFIPARSFSASRISYKSYKLLIIGGGSGGTATANKFANKVGKGNIAVIEPSKYHYYQPLWTLVGGGIKQFEESQYLTEKLLPGNCDWIQDKAVQFDPVKCTVTTEKGQLIHYDYLVCAMGLQLNYHLIKGLPEAFDIDPQICSNYSAQTVNLTRPAMENFKEGNVIFTFPNSPIKCAGAPQKIMYLTEEYLRKSGKRDKAKVIYNTSLPVIFGVKKYAAALTKIVKERNIVVNFRHNLVEVRPERKEAIFEMLDEQQKGTGKLVTMSYAFLHVSPPMSSPDVLRHSPLVDAAGFVAVDKETLQHVKFPNVFAIGDNSNIPTAKTAAAVASEIKTLSKNLDAFMNGKPLKSKYDGYTSCPLVTGNGRCILAEFDWDLNPMETFPFDQGKERRSMYFMKAEVFPRMYWHMFLKGLWNGPGFMRKAFRLGMAK